MFHVNNSFTNKVFLVQKGTYSLRRFVLETILLEKHIFYLSSLKGFLLNWSVFLIVLRCLVVFLLYL